VIIGDASEAPEIIAGDKLNKYNVFFNFLILIFFL